MKFRQCNVTVNGLISSRFKKRKQYIIENFFSKFKSISKRQINILNSKDFYELQSFSNERNRESFEYEILSFKHIFLEMFLLFRFRLVLLLGDNSNGHKKTTLY